MLITITDNNTRTATRIFIGCHEMSTKFLEFMYSAEEDISVRHQEMEPQRALKILSGRGEKELERAMAYVGLFYANREGNIL